jgi:hypothetical protein
MILVRNSLPDDRNCKTAGAGKETYAPGSEDSAGRNPEGAAIVVVPEEELVVAKKVEKNVEVWTGSVTVSVSRTVLVISMVLCQSLCVRTAVRQ